jgi:hypothetical protein
MVRRLKNIAVNMVVFVNFKAFVIEDRKMTQSKSKFFMPLALHEQKFEAFLYSVHASDKLLGPVLCSMWTAAK